ncbi:MAG: DUF6036 family nucleotidyltransferase [Lachnospiraceae bacterium]|nr:DUF6036 family nucleotidyltransferase [Lachnospiraceae bacterium]
MSMEYKTDSSLLSEQHNTLLLVDTIVGQADLAMRPSFELLGGTALLFHGVEAVFTVDIDVANAQSETVKKLVEPFISDMASTVVYLAKNYKDRLIPYPEGQFTNIDVWLLSIEDLIITKLYAWRHKDQEDLVKTNLFSKCNFATLTRIINDEFPVEEASKLLTRLSTI